MANVVTNVGLDALLEAMNTALGYLAVGSGTTAPAVGDTVLQTELDRVATTNESSTVSAGVATSVIEAFFPTGDGNGTIAEWGLLDASSSGNLYLHGQPTSPVTKTSAKQLRVTITTKLRWVAAFSS